jgi:hypothetical protein
MKVVFLEKANNFYIGRFWVFKEFLENVAKVLETGMDIRGFDRGLTRVWPLVSVDLINECISTI